MISNVWVVKRSMTRSHGWDRLSRKKLFQLELSRGWRSSINNLVGLRYNLGLNSQSASSEQDKLSGGRHGGYTWTKDRQRGKNTESTGMSKVAQWTEMKQK